MTNLLKRATSGFIYAVLFITAILYSKESYIFLISLFGFISIREFLNLLKFNNIIIYVLFVGLIYLPFSSLDSSVLIDVLLVLSLSGSIQLLVNLFIKKKNYPSSTIQKLDISIRYLLLSFAFLILLPFINGGYEASVILSLIIFIWVNDSFAFFVGKNLGKSTNNSSFLENFQLLDFLSLQGATLGGFGIKKPFLCNGANLAYKKTVFLELNGFQGNDNIASGDDIFLFEKFYKKHPNCVHFLKSNKAIVRTNALKSWKELIQQRMRWAAKSSSYTLGMGKFVGIIVLLMNLAFIICMLGIFNDLENSINYLYCMLLKVGVDFILIKQIAVFYTGNSQKIRAYLLGSLLYPFFSTYIIFKTLTSSYTWKERIFKR